MFRYASHLPVTFSLNGLGLGPRAIIPNPRHDDRLFSDPDITNKSTDQTALERARTVHTMAKRRRHYSKLEEELLFRENHTCAICRNPNKDVQIHHIDGNSENNVLVNLVVLCLDCHSKVTGPRGLGRSFQHGEVRRYKRSWEKAVEQSRQVKQVHSGSTTELLPTIDLLVCEILALPPRSTRIATIFRLLYEIQLWKGDNQLRTRIIDGFGHLAIMCGLSQEGIAARRLATTTWQFCWHFVGPEDVSMDSADAQFVTQCVDVLSTLGHFTCEFTGREDVLKETTSALENFFDVACWYSDEHIMNAVIEAYRKSIEGSKGNDEGFERGLAILNGSIQNLTESLSEAGLGWEKEERTLNELIAMCAT